MNERSFAFAMQQRLVDAAIAPVVFENQNANPARPFIFVQHVPTEVVSLDIAGGSRVHRGFMAATAVIAEGEFATAGLIIVDQIAELYPAGLRLNGADYTVTIPRPVQRQTGFQDQQDYRLPITVPYEGTGFSGGLSPDPEVPPPVQVQVYTQATPALTWTVNHNLGRETQVSVQTLGGVELLASIVHTSPNQFVVSFNAPQSGRAIYS